MAVQLTRRALALAALGGALIAALCSPLPAVADTTFMVTSTADTDGSTCGAECTLRQAINAANAAGGQDTIRFALAGSSPIVLGSELPAISDQAGLTIDGAGSTNVTIDGGNARVISVDQGAQLTLADLTVENGNAGADNGGAVFNQEGTLTVRDATLSGNTAGASGGAIYNNGGVVTVTGSTFSANRAAAGAGGAILNTADGGLAVTNSTFAGNVAGSGGAILNTGGAGLVMSYSTLFQNRANQGGGGGILNDPSGGTATVRGTILAGSPPGQGGSCSGTIADGGYDIDDGTTCGFSSANHSVSNANPRLDPHGLQSNGGPTQTVALLPASPAVDTIPPGTIGCGTDVVTDQRGTHRPQGPRCDSGAFELAQTPGQIVVDTAADEQQPNGLCSLREAIVNANQNSQAGSPDCAAGIGNDTIVFELGSPSARITLSAQLGALPAATDRRGLTIDGGSASAVTVSGGNAVRVFEVDTGDQLALANLTVANGTPGPNGFFGGGAVLNLGGKLAVTDSTFAGNAAGGAGTGGAISSISGGTLTVARSTFTGNTTPDSNPSGATVGGGAIVNAGDATVTDSTFSGNHSGGGGALQNVVTLRVSGSTFTDNTSSGGGGAIQSDSSLTVTNSTFAANTAAGGGGGIDNAATATIVYSTFAGNSAQSGGGILTEATPEQNTVLRGTILAGNAPGGNCAGIQIDQGFNIDDATTCGFSLANRSHPATNPLLDPQGLQNNGGPTQTIGLQPQSPAIDNIPVGTIGCGTTVATDQRGVTRPQGPSCDVGAFERNAGLGSGPGHGKKPKKPKKPKNPKR